MAYSTVQRVALASGLVLAVSLLLPKAFLSRGKRQEPPPAPEGKRGPAPPPRAAGRARAPRALLEGGRPRGSPAPRSLGGAKRQGSLGLSEQRADRVPSGLPCRSARRRAWTRSPVALTSSPRWPNSTSHYLPKSFESGGLPLEFPFLGCPCAFSRAFEWNSWTGYC